MIKEALVCLEGSASSEAATRLAIGDRDESAAPRLVGLAIVDEPDIRAGAATGIGGASYKHERDEALVADAQHARGRLRWRCSNAAAAKRASTPRPGDRGPAGGQHPDEMETRDLTVIGRDANFRFETESDDAATREAILHRATRPGAAGARERRAGPLGQHVVVAYDGSGAAKRAIASFAASGLARVAQRPRRDRRRQRRAGLGDGQPAA